MAEKQELNYIVRNMTQTDLDGVRELWSMVNFVLFKYANEVFQQIDPEGFFVAEEVGTGVWRTN